MPLPFLRVLGTSILSSPLKYLPVKLFLFFITSSGVPKATTLPPFSPAPGPMSTKKSHCLIVSSSCSTTIKVLPKSLISLRLFISLWLSLWWSPIEGSSRTYNTPESLLPIWVASLILWASPPDNVSALLFNVK